jgi:hypothetical protein
MTVEARVWGTHLARHIRRELDAALTDAGAQGPRILKVVLYELCHVTLHDVRHAPTKVARRLDRALRDADVPSYQAFQLAKKAVDAAARADLLAILDSIPPPNGNSDFNAGHEQARQRLRQAVHAGALPQTLSIEGTSDTQAGAAAFVDCLHHTIGGLP